MAQHGYLHDEYDRDWDRGDDRDRERSEREWRGGSGDQDWRDRDRGEQRSGRMMFGERDREQDRYSRGARSAWENNRDWPQRDRGMSGSGQNRYASDQSRGSYGSGQWENERGGNRPSAHPDDHYRSWRDNHMQSLDREYADYCREREQQFHRDFDTWRQNRRPYRQQDHGLRGKYGAEQGSGPDEQTFTPQTTAAGNTMTTSETHEPQSTTDPEDTATIGTYKRGR